MTATGADQNAGFGLRLATIFLEPATYRFDVAKACIFDPGVGFRVWSGSRSIDLLLCFNCDEFQFIARDGGGQVVHSGGEDFDSSRPALLMLAREAFPGDQEIQSLK